MQTAIYEQLFVGERQIIMTHFVPLGQRNGREMFAFGYWRPDGTYKIGIADYRSDGEFAELKAAYLLPEKSASAT